MENELIFFDCPAYLASDGGTRCGLPAEVEYSHTQRSTGGLLECAKIRCPLGHWFNGPVEFLTISESVRGAVARVCAPEEHRAAHAAQDVRR